MNLTLLHIGVDSTDSATRGMCTTYLGACLLESLEKEHGARTVHFPELVRLNPNVPWKTRGNGAVCIRVEAEEALVSSILGTCVEAVNRFSVLEDPQTNPGLALLKGRVPKDLSAFYGRALHRIIEVKEALELARSSGAIFRTWKNGRGLIGALSAIGACLGEDSTYETILYRPIGRTERGRSVDPASIRKASFRHPTTFFNTDEKGVPVCIPHSPCPVVVGIRATDHAGSYGAAKDIEASGVERWVLWRTNQHTDAHIEEATSLSLVRPYSSISIETVVSSTPSYGKGGHLTFDIRDGHGNVMPCYAYEPTKTFRKPISHLLPGDRVRLWASVRPQGPDHPMSLNLEKLEVVDLAEVHSMENQRCPLCGGATSSMGKGQGLRCKVCGNRDPSLKKSRVKVERRIEIGPIQPPICAWRHLFRPFALPAGATGPWKGPSWGLGHPGVERT